MSELKFTRVNNEEYNTVNINIENAFIEMKEKDYRYINKQKKKQNSDIMKYILDYLTTI